MYYLTEILTVLPVKPLKKKKISNTSIIYHAKREIKNSVEMVI